MTTIPEICDQPVQDEDQIDGPDQFLNLLAVARRKGATVRALARLAGVSKSTMGRWLPAIEALALSQTGHTEDEK
jgi:DNA-binding MarR family transcriptional regulator